MRRLLGGMLQAVVDAGATARIGAGPHERSEARTTQRNGTRDKLVTTAAGYLTVKIPKVRTGSFFPALLAPRRRIDVALHAVVMQAYVEGVSTRRVDDLVIAMGGTGISKSEVSRICAQLDSEVALWRSNRPSQKAASFPVHPRRGIEGTAAQGDPRSEDAGPAQRDGVRRLRDPLGRIAALLVAS
jgi:putative transposase